MTLQDRCGGLWEQFKQSPARPFARINIPAAKTDKPERGEFQPGQHYFVVRVNEMFLSYERQWFRTYLPMVTVVSEFQYGRDKQAVPFVVGPSILERYGLTLPERGLIISNTRVAGIHPFRGGRLSLAVILYKLNRSDAAKKLLEVVESAATAVDFSTALGGYLKIGNVVLDGIERLFSLSPVQPVIGWRNEFDKEAGDIFRPRYFAIIDAPQQQVPPEDFSVREDRLLYRGKEFRDADYVLYSIAQADEREDIQMLPFEELWSKVREDAALPTEDGWKSAKANMVALYQRMTQSPDLTDCQANALADQYVGIMKTLHDRAVRLGNLAAHHAPAADPEQQRADAARQRSLSLMEM